MTTIFILQKLLFCFAILCLYLPTSSLGISERLYSSGLLEAKVVFVDISKMSVKRRCRNRGCQIFLGKKYQSGKNIPNLLELYQISINITKDCKMDQVSIKYTNIFHCKTLQNLPKLGCLVWKRTIWQPCRRCKTRLVWHSRFLSDLFISEIMCERKKQVDQNQGDRMSFLKT
jgi:hypothetical protein